jgi:hypothetical protein
VERIEVHSPSSSAWLYSSHYDSSDYPGRIEIHEGKIVSQPMIGKATDDPLEAAGFINEWRDFISAVKTSSATISNFQNAWSAMSLAEEIEKYSTEK